MIGWLDCTAGASGDMFLGALVDAGAPIEKIHEAIGALAVEPIQLRVSTTKRHGIGGTKVDVIAPRSVVTRTWANIRRSLEAAELDDWVKASSIAAFERLANAEADVHRTTPEQVHFHEVGGLDAIADVVGTMAGLRALGIESLAASEVSLGSGMVRGEHGMVPIPGPATLALLRDAEAPVWSGPAPYEMCTPTGAALLATTVTQWGPMPKMTVRRVGAGAGSRELDEVPNLLRLVLGEPVSADRAATSEDYVLETNVDDLDPRLWPTVLEALLEAGAADAWLTPILMKKGRPAHTLHVLCDAVAVRAVRAAVFATTSTIGLRERTVTKLALDREHTTITVDGQPIGVKLARLEGRVVNVSVEFEDVRRAAVVTGRATRDLLATATAAAHAQFDDTGE